MTYFQTEAHQNLREYIRCYWKLENKDDDFKNYTILPDGFFDLLICYHKNNLKEIILTGLWDINTNVLVHPNTTIYGVQFRLLAMENIIKESISPILNGIKSLEKSYLRLDEFNENSSSCLFEHLNQGLLCCIESQSPIDPRKSILLKSINQTKGSKTVEYYSQTAFWSKRQINRYFQSTFGISLKKYCIIRKGASNYSQIKNRKLNPQKGYFDQSHFIKNIKRITGFTPKTLLKNENDRFLQFSIIKNK